MTAQDLAGLAQSCIAYKLRPEHFEKLSALADPVYFQNGQQFITHKALEADLYVILEVAQHPIFQRDGANLYCRVPIPMTVAALGGNIEVPTIDGEMMPMDIEHGTQTGQRTRLRHKGMSVLRSSARGDLYVELSVETPVHLTKRQKELLKEFADESGDHKTNPESAGFLNKVKEMLKG